MASNRWIAIDPDVLNHPLVGAGQAVEPFDKSRGAYSRTEAWIWLIANARFEAGYIYNKGLKMRLERGQMMAAYSYLAGEWNWSQKTVRVWLEKLIDERMLSKKLPGQAEFGSMEEPIPATALTSVSTRHRSEWGKRQGNQIQVLTLCNYEGYQFQRWELGQANGQAEGKRGASEGQARGKNLTRETKETYLTPLPPIATGTAEASPSSGGENGFLLVDEERPVVRQTKPPLPAARLAVVRQAIAAYNELAGRHGFSKCTAESRSRLHRLDRRIADIGGLDNFVRAIGAIERVPFLMGKVPPKEGQQPFRLDIDRLLQTDGNLGDVLAKLLDRAGEIATTASTAPWWSDPTRVAATTDADWRRLIAEHANGRWPLFQLGPPPGTRGCIVPQRVSAELRLEDRYDDKGIARDGSH